MEADLARLFKTGYYIPQISRMAKSINEPSTVFSIENKLENIKMERTYLRR